MDGQLHSSAAALIGSREAVAQPEGRASDCPASLLTGACLVLEARTGPRGQACVPAHLPAPPATPDATEGLCAIASGGTSADADVSVGCLLLAEVVEPPADLVIHQRIGLGSGRADSLSSADRLPAERPSAPGPLLPVSAATAAAGAAPSVPPPLPYTRYWPPLDALAAAPPPSSYQPFLRHHVTHVKLRGVDPSMLSPGYQQRLRELVAARTGRLLSHAYVRPGCIELVLDCEEWGSGTLPRLSASGSWSGRSSGSWEAREGGGAGSEPGGEPGGGGGGGAGAGGASAGPLLRTRCSDDILVLLGSTGSSASGYGGGAAGGDNGSGDNAMASRPRQGPVGAEGGRAAGALAETGLQAWEVVQALQLTVPQPCGQDDPQLSLLSSSEGQYFAVGAGSTSQGRGALSSGSGSQAFMLLAAARPDTPRSEAASDYMLQIEGQLVTRPLASGPTDVPPRVVSVEPRVLLLPLGPESEASGQPHAATSLAFEATVRGAADDNSLELLVRAEGRYLPARVTTPSPAESAPGPGPHPGPGPGPPPAGSDAGGGGDVGACRTYRVELPPAASCSLRPGIVLCDLRCSGVPVAAAPLLAVRQAGLAEELLAALPPGELPDEERDSLLMDLGTWLFHTGEAGRPRAGAQQQQLQPTWAAAVSGAVGVEAEVAERLPLLGLHLLRYARQSGWAATAACLQQGLEQLGVALRGRGPQPGETAGQGQQQPAGAGAGAGAAQPQAAKAAEHRAEGRGPGAAARASAARPSRPSVQLHRSAAGTARPAVASAAPASNSAPQVFTRRWRRQPAPQLPGTSALAPSARASGGSMAANGGACCSPAARPASAVRLSSVRGALAAVLGLVRAPAGEEAAYRAYVEARTASQGHIMAFIDVLAVLMALLNLLGSPASGSQAGTLLSCWVGVLQVGLRLALPYRIWLRTQRVTGLLRYAAYLGVKAGLGCGLIVLPRGVERYLLGPGILVQEGLVHPAAETASPPVLLCLVLTPLRALTNVVLILKVAPSVGLSGAACRAVAVSCLEAATTVAVHVYMRLEFARRAEAKDRAKAFPE